MSETRQSATTLPTIGFVGAGKGGQTLAAALAAAGMPVVAVASRSPLSAARLAALAGIPRSGVYATGAEVAAQAELTFLTVPDDAIAVAAGEITAAGGWRPGHAVLHCSGALSSAVLPAAAAHGCRTASFHPLQTFAVVPADRAEAVARLTGIVFGLEGDDALRPVLETLAVRLGGRPLWLQPEEKPIYHAAAVLTSNYTVVLVALAAARFDDRRTWQRDH